MSVEDIDKVMSSGLGMRYAFIGPLETAHLNAKGTLRCRTGMGDVVEIVNNLDLLNGKCIIYIN